MQYSAEISRAHPSCFFLVLDQSGSMEDPFAGSDTGRSKAQEVADVINRLLQTIISRSASWGTARRSRRPCAVRWRAATPSVSANWR
jgi:hypothetical protein